MPAPKLLSLLPMLLEEVKAPFDDPGWAFEVKYDGYRCLAGWESNGGHLRSKTGTDMTTWFPEIAVALATVKRGRCIVDGEVCVLNDEGIAGDPEFRRLTSRAARRTYRPGMELTTFVAFDLLVERGRNLMDLPWLERKTRLQALLENTPLVRVADHVLGTGRGMYQAAVRLELEGIVAKRIDSPYLPGTRSNNWLKIKRPGAVPPERFKRR